MWGKGIFFLAGCTNTGGELGKPSRCHIKHILVCGQIEGGNKMGKEEINTVNNTCKKQSLARAVGLRESSCPGLLSGYREEWLSVLS